MIDLVLASNNVGKGAELQTLLRDDMVVNTLTTSDSTLQMKLVQPSLRMRRSRRLRPRGLADS